MSRLAILSPPKAYLAMIVATFFSAWVFTRVPASDPGADPGAPSANTPTETGMAAVAFALSVDAPPIPDDAFDRPLMADGRRIAAPAVETPEVAQSPADPQPAPETAPPPAAPPPPILFKGYMLAGGEPKALLVWDPEPAEIWYSIGAERGGWRITAIDDRSVTARNGTAEITIKMFD